MKSRPSSTDSTPAPTKTDGNVMVPGLFARVQLGGGDVMTKAVMISDRAVGTDIPLFY